MMQQTNIGLLTYRHIRGWHELVNAKSVYQEKLIEKLIKISA
jgi:hypothetical protein